MHLASEGTSIYRRTLHPRHTQLKINLEKKKVEGEDQHIRASPLISTQEHGTHEPVLTHVYTYTNMHTPKSYTQKCSIVLVFLFTLFGFWVLLLLFKT